MTTDTEKLTAWMIRHSFATGHGDTMEDLLEELSWQVLDLQVPSSADREKTEQLNKEAPSLDVYLSFAREIIDCLESNNRSSAIRKLLHFTRTSELP